MKGKPPEIRKLIIKNMVCPRCISAVEQIFHSLEIPIEKISLGIITLPPHTNPDLKKLAFELKRFGFELIDDPHHRLVEQIKTTLIEILYQKEEVKITLSKFLEEKFNREYSQLSRSFSQFEGKTIERYFILQKIERVKELLLYQEKSLSEIAFELGYSSVAHLSHQFKKETGMSPSTYRKEADQGRLFIDSL